MGDSHTRDLDQNAWGYKLDIKVAVLELIRSIGEVIEGLSRPGLKTVFLLIVMLGVQVMAPSLLAGGEKTPLSPEQREEAKAYFMEGKAAFGEGQYDEARVSFQRAYAIVQSPEILYNIGKCYEKMGDEEEAVYHYEPTADDSEEVRSIFLVK